MIHIRTEDKRVGGSLMNDQRLCDTFLPKMRRKQNELRQQIEEALRREDNAAYIQLEERYRSLSIMIAKMSEDVSRLGA